LLRGTNLSNICQKSVNRSNKKSLQCQTFEAKTRFVGYSQMFLGIILAMEAVLS